MLMPDANERNVNVGSIAQLSIRVIKNDVTTVSKQRFAEIILLSCAAFYEQVMIIKTHSTLSDG